MQGDADADDDDDDDADDDVALHGGQSLHAIIVACLVHLAWAGGSTVSDVGWILSE